MKTCSVCSKEKDENEFRFRNKAKGTRSPWCKPCFSDYERQKWASCPERRKSNTSHGTARRKRNSQFVWDFLKCNSCPCGETNPILLEFDHRVRETKSFDVSDAVRIGMSIARIESEIAKCDVLCVKCHRLRTAEQMGWYKDIVR